MQIHCTGWSHWEWVSCICFSSSSSNSIIISYAWDEQVKVWNLANCKLKTSHTSRLGFLNAVIISPDGSLCASGGKDGQAMLWSFNKSKDLYKLDSGDIINSLCFSPNHRPPTSRSGTWRARSLWMKWSKKLSGPAARQSHPSAPLWSSLLMAKVLDSNYPIQSSVSLPRLCQWWW